MNAPCTNTYAGPGVLRFECVISPNATMVILAPALACFAGAWVPRVLDMWPRGTWPMPLSPVTPAPCSLQVLVEGRRQIAEPWEFTAPESCPVEWEALDQRRGVEFIVEAGSKGVHFLAELRCDLHSSSLEAT